MSVSFTKRRYEEFTLKRFTVGTSGFVTFTTDSSKGFGVDESQLSRPVVEGREYVLECKDFNTIAGLYDADGCLFRLSDETLDERHNQMMDDITKKHYDFIDANYEDYKDRTHALPAKFRDRLLRRLAEDPEFKYDFMGWAYTLVAYELAAIMIEHGAESQEADDFSSDQGVSGNQWGFAKAVARNEGARND